MTSLPYGVWLVYGDGSNFERIYYVKPHDLEHGEKLVFWNFGEPKVKAIQRGGQ